MVSAALIAALSFGLLVVANAQTSVVSNQYQLFAPTVPTNTTIAYADQLKPECGSNAIFTVSVFPANANFADAVAAPVGYVQTKLYNLHTLTTYGLTQQKLDPAPAGTYTASVTFDYTHFHLPPAIYRLWAFFEGDETYIHSETIQKYNVPASCILQ